MTTLQKATLNYALSGLQKERSGGPREKSRRLTGMPSVSLRRPGLRVSNMTIPDSNIFRNITIFDAPYYLTDDGFTRWLKISNTHLNDLIQVVALFGWAEIEKRPDPCQPHIQSLVKVQVDKVHEMNVSFRTECGVIINWHRLNPFYEELQALGISKPAKEWKTALE